MSLARSLVPSLLKDSVPSLLEGNLPIVDSSLSVHHMAYGVGFVKDDLMIVDGSDFAAQWNGLNGTTNNSIQTVQTQKPLYVANAINTQPALRFDGVSDYLINTGLSITTDELTIFVVVKRLSKPSGYRRTVSLVQSGGADFNNTAHTTFIETNPEEELQDWRNGIKATASHPGNNIPFIATSEFTSTTNTLYLNGVASSPVAVSGNFNINVMTIGIGYDTGPIAPANVEIGELIIYNRALSSQERSLVEQYLSNKWSIALS